MRSTEIEEEDEEQWRMQPPHFSRSLHNEANKANSAMAVVE
jgi:hypothetical protein